MTKTSLKYWLLNAPMFFATRTFLAMFILFILTGLLLPKTDTYITITGILIGLILITTTIQTIRRIPIKKIDRTGFVTLTNTQAILSWICGIAFTLIATTTMYLTNIFSMDKFILLFIAATFVLFSLFYFIGLSITVVWSRFLRARTLNVPTWKIICSYPFGFDMLWMPGYFIPNKKDRSPVITTEKKWIANLTNWTMARPANAAFFLTMILVITGLAGGFHPVALLSLSMLMLFAIWIMQIGAKKFEKNIGGAYATIAVIINLIIITYISIIIQIQIQ